MTMSDVAVVFDLELQDKICRGCLAISSKDLLPLDYNVLRYFGEMSTINIFEKETLPHKFCDNCLKTLKQCIEFHNQCLRAGIILLDQLKICLYNKGKCDLETLRRGRQEIVNLHRSLTSVVNDNATKQNLTESNQLAEKIERTDQKNLFAIEKVYSMDPLQFSSGSDPNRSDSLMMEVDIKKELTDQTLNSFNDSESDEENTERFNECIDNLQMVDGVLQLKSEKIGDESQTNGDVCNDSKRVSRRGGKIGDVLNETNCKIKKLNTQEQIREMENARKNSSFMSSPFKCNLCAQGFTDEIALKDHAVEHEEVNNQTNEETTLIEYVLSEKNRVKLAESGHLYIKDRERDGKIFWKCDLHKKMYCKARLHVVNNIINKRVGEHTHVGDAARIEVAKIIHLIKDRAISSQDETDRILSEGYMGLSEAVINQMPNKQALKKMIQNTRNRGDSQVVPPYPGTLNDLQIPIDYQVTDENDQFR